MRLQKVRSLPFGEFSDCFDRNLVFVFSQKFFFSFWLRLEKKKEMGCRPFKQAGEEFGVGYFFPYIKLVTSQMKKLSLFDFAFLLNVLNITGLLSILPSIA